MLLYVGGGGDAFSMDFACTVRLGESRFVFCLTGDEPMGVATAIPAGTTTRTRALWGSNAVTRGTMRAKQCLPCFVASHKVF